MNEPVRVSAEIVAQSTSSDGSLGGAILAVVLLVAVLFFASRRIGGLRTLRGGDRPLLRGGLDVRGTGFGLVFASVAAAQLVVTVIDAGIKTDQRDGIIVFVAVCFGSLLALALGLGGRSRTLDVLAVVAGIVFSLLATGIDHGSGGVAAVLVLALMLLFLAGVVRALRP